MHNCAFFGFINYLCYTLFGDYMIKLDDLYLCDNPDIDEYIEFYNYIKDSLDYKDFLGMFNKSDLINIRDNVGKIWMYKLNKEIICTCMYIDGDIDTVNDFNLDYDYKDICELGQVMVNPKYRGNKLMYQMLQVFNNYCILNNKKYVITTAHPNNIYSINNMLDDNYEFKELFKLKRGDRNLYIKKLK